MSLRDAILGYAKASAAPAQPVPCDDYPAFAGLCVRRISPREMDEAQSSDEGDDTNYRARWFCIFAADAAGERLFAASDVRAVCGLDILPLVERVLYFGRQYNGLTEESRKGLAKNCGGGGQDGSAISSSAPSLGSPSASAST